MICKYFKNSEYIEIIIHIYIYVYLYKHVWSRLKIIATPKRRLTTEIGRLDA